MSLPPLNPLPRAILFDLDDTLCDYSTAREARLRIAFTRGVDGRAVRRSDELLNRMIAASIERHPHGSDHFAALFADFGIGDEREAEAAARWFRTNRFHGLELFPGVVEVLQAVRRTSRAGAPPRPVGVITNGPAEVQRAKVDLLGIEALVDFTIVSEEFGVAKPDPSIFAAALDIAEVAPRDAVFIGDAAEFDIAGAQAAGIPTIWVNRDESPWPGPESPPDRIVRRVAEVPGLVGSGRRAAPARE